MKTFVLCKLTPGKEQTAVRTIRAIEGVTEVYMVFGGWDMILAAESDTVDKLSNLIVSRIRAVDGVAATETLVTTSL
ncbi:MAG: Lrp/AsnC ligand binding domain-containing protein [Elusimicrobiota bacterium]|nr:Lrp/AsnC ligand binding domain-containing protein [Elusimicrobiota bacterium]